MSDYPGWTTITAPGNRPSGFTVTLDGSLELLNDATEEDIFDPDWNDDSVRTSGTPSSTSIKIDLGSQYQVTKARVRWGSNEPPSDVSSDHLRHAYCWVEASLNDSNYTALVAIFFPHWSRDNYKDYSEFILGDDVDSYRYFRFYWFIPDDKSDGTAYNAALGALRGLDLFTGWFESETEEQDFEITYLSDPEYPTSTDIDSDDPPENIFDRDITTGLYTEETNGGTIYRVTHRLETTRLTTYFLIWLYGGGSHGDSDHCKISILGSNNDGITWHSILPADGELRIPPLSSNSDGVPSDSSRLTPFNLDLSGVLSTTYRKYRLQIYVNHSADQYSPFDFRRFDLCLSGAWAIVEAESPPWSIDASAVTSVAYHDGYEVEGYTGCSTYGQGETDEGEDLGWMLGIPHPGYSSEGYTGYVAGEDISEYENHVLEVEPSVEGKTGILGSGDYAYEIEALAGFGRIADADLEWPSHEVDARPTEVGNADLDFSGWLSGSLARCEGHTGYVSNDLQVYPSGEGHSLSGPLASASMSLGKSWKVSAGTGCLATARYSPGSISGSLTIGVLAQLYQKIFPYTLTANAKVSQAANGTSFYSYDLSGHALHAHFSHGSILERLYRASATLTVGQIATGDAHCSFSVNADAISDQNSSANASMPPYEMCARVSTARFENYILKYGESA